MKKSANGLLLSVAAIGLAGCSTSANDAAMQFSTQTVIDQINKLNLESTVETTTADLVGVAEMKGWYGFWIPDDTAILSAMGAARTTVDFASKSITGSVEDLRVLEVTRDEFDANNQYIFESTEVTRLSGSLGIAGEVTGTSFLASVNGRLTGDYTGEFGTFGNYTADVQSQVVGNFWKTASGDLMLAGDTTGSFTISPEAGTPTLNIIEGGGLLVSE